VGGSLVSGDQVLNVPFCHDGRLAGTGAGIESDVAVKVQTKPLTVIEFNQENAPPV
tara:strand:+ start:58 stop:225 length:168 start_codon:yes stop_codon:yes gene_type:complete